MIKRSKSGLTWISLAILMVITIVIFFSLPYTQPLNNSCLDKNGSDGTYRHVIIDSILMSYNKDTSRTLQFQQHNLESKWLGEIMKAEKNLTQNVNHGKSSTASWSDPIFLGKFIFSILFSLASIYIILANKYDEKTKQWAFSVLTLIAGIWIGSFT